jgi:hypothetical protein
MSELANYDDDDGFESALHPSGRLMRGMHARWTDAKGWHDRDGAPIPSPLLAASTDTALQRWRNNVPEVITAKPLPDPDELNAAIPRAEWEIGLDGQPRVPWQTVLAVYLVHVESGQLFTAVNSTVGWRMAVEALREQVAVKRMLCSGARVLPVVDLQSRPFRTSFGDRKRPHLQIVDWKSGGEPAPQLTAPKHPPATATILADAPKSVSSEQFFDDEIPWK